MRPADRALCGFVLTARGRPRTGSRAFEAGADDYLTKPFAFADLVARAQALLGLVLPAP